MNLEKLKKLLRATPPGKWSIQPHSGGWEKRFEIYGAGDGLYVDYDDVDPKVQDRMAKWLIEIHNAAPELLALLETLPKETP